MSEMQRMLADDRFSETVSILREESTNEGGRGRTKEYKKQEEIQAIISPGNGNNVEISGQVVGRSDYDLLTLVDANLQRGDRVLRETGERLNVLALLRVTEMIPHIEARLEVIH